MTSLPFHPKRVSLIVKLWGKDRTSKSYSRWRRSNKRLHADQFSSATLRLKFTKVIQRQYSGQEDFGWGFDSNFGEEETSYNRHLPLVPGTIADDNGYIIYDSPAGPENSDGSWNCRTGAVNEHCTPRRWGRGQASLRGERGKTNNTEKGAWQHVFALLISTDKRRKFHSKYIMLMNWKLSYAVFSVYYILTTICPCCVGLLCCSMHVNALWLHFSWNEYSMYSSMLSQILTKSNLIDTVS